MSKIKAAPSTGTRGKHSPPPSPPICDAAQIPIRTAIEQGLQVSVPTGYRLIAEGKLRTHTYGGRRFTTQADLAACVELLRKESAAA